MTNKTSIDELKAEVARCGAEWKLADEKCAAIIKAAKEEAQPYHTALKAAEAKLNEARCRAVGVWTGDVVMFKRGYRDDWQPGLVTEAQHRSGGEAILTVSRRKKNGEWYANTLSWVHEWRLPTDDERKEYGL